MKMPLLLVVTAIAFTVASCSDNKSATEESSAPATDPSTAASAPAEIISSDPVTTGEQSAIQPSDAPAAVVNPVASPNPAATVASSGNQGPLNPAHGEPGHRCEIPVGAPLSSAPAIAPASGNVQMPTPSQPNVTQQVQLQADPNSNSIMSAPAPAASGTTAPGMNPPHGEPGHDCAIPVGAPLKK